MTALHEIIRRSRRLSAASRERYLRDVDMWTTWAGEDPRNWTRERVIAFYDSLLSRMKPQSANRVLVSLRYALKWLAVEQQQPALAEITRIELAQTQQQKHVDSLTPEQAERLLNTTHKGSLVDLRDRFLIVCGLETGMRRASLASLRFDHISETPGYPVAQVVMKGHGKDLWEVPLSDLVVHSLAVWERAFSLSRGKQQHRGGADPVLRRIVRGTPEMNDHGQMIYPTTATDDGISETMIYKIITTRAEAAGLAHVHPHMFRHTFVTWRRNQGLKPEEIAAITGHDIKRLYGAMGGYMNMVEIGGRVRNETPPWLAAAVHRLDGR